MRESEGEGERRRKMMVRERVDVMIRERMSGMVKRRW
jgi:hypothetical protein